MGIFLRHTQTELYPLRFKSVGINTFGEISWTDLVSYWHFFPNRSGQTVWQQRRAGIYPTNGREAVSPALMRERWRLRAGNVRKLSQCLEQVLCFNQSSTAEDSVSTRRPPSQSPSYTPHISLLLSPGYQSDRVGFLMRKERPSQQCLLPID